MEIISDEDFEKLKFEAISCMPNPVLIINPIHRDRFKGDFEIKEHCWMPTDRLIFTDKSNLYQFNLDDFQCHENKQD